MLDKVEDAWDGIFWLVGNVVFVGRVVVLTV
jgi:hypothetical protein